MTSHEVTDGSWHKATVYAESRSEPEPVTKAARVDQSAAMVLMNSNILAPSFEWVRRNRDGSVKIWAIVDVGVQL